MTNAYDFFPHDDMPHYWYFLPVEIDHPVSNIKISLKNYKFNLRYYGFKREKW